MRKKLKNTFVSHKGNGHHPKILRKKGIYATVGIILAVQAFIVIGAFVIPRLDGQLASVLPSVVTLLTNDLRNKSNLSSLATNSLLVNAAQAKANDMASKGYFAHVSPEGLEPWDWVGRAGYDYAYAGENLAVNFTDSEQVIEAWEHSPTHYQNIIKDKYTEIGVAVATGTYEGREATFVVQMFASPIQVTASKGIKATPTSVAISEPEAGDKNTENVSVVNKNSQTEILGTEISKAPSPSFVSRILSSSRTYGGYVLLAMTLLFMIIMVSGFGKHHPHAMAGGVFVMATLALFIYVDEKVLFPDLELPVDVEYSANAIGALKR